MVSHIGHSFSLCSSSALERFVFLCLTFYLACCQSMGNEAILGEKNGWLHGWQAQIYREHAPSHFRASPGRWWLKSLLVETGGHRRKKNPSNQLGGEHSMVNGTERKKSLHGLVTENGRGEDRP
jgi:hypothetical protein